MFPHMARQSQEQAGSDEEYELRPVEDARFYDLEHDAKIVGWRVDVFEALGFNHFQSAAMAVRRDVDRADVQRMIGAGATPQQVLLILL